jgi:hypothetical protein
MPRKKKLKKNKEKSEEAETLSQQLAEAVNGLIYMSETDAEITVFEGQRTDSVTRENFLAQIGKSDLKVEEKDFNDFFRPLTEIQDWYGEDERRMTEKFNELKILLQQNLIDKKVFRLGKKEIDIYVVGLDGQNILRGVQTKAVET